MENIEPVVIETSAEEGGPNRFLLFLIFIPTFIVAYLVPFLATLYSKTNAKKWIFYWLCLLAANILLRPLLNFIFSPYSAAFLFMVVTAILVYVSSNEKSQIWVQACNMVAGIAQQQWSSLKQKGQSLLRTYNLIE